jgi:hypothetical protein
VHDRSRRLGTAAQRFEVLNENGAGRRRPIARTSPGHPSGRLEHRAVADRSASSHSRFRCGWATIRHGAQPSIALAAMRLAAGIPAIDPADDRDPARVAGVREVVVARPIPAGRAVRGTRGRRDARAPIGAPRPSRRWPTVRRRSPACPRSPALKWVAAAKELVAADCAIDLHAARVK